MKGFSFVCLFVCFFVCFFFVCFFVLFSKYYFSNINVFMFQLMFFCFVHDFIEKSSLGKVFFFCFVLFFFFFKFWSRDLVHAIKIRILADILT